MKKVLLLITLATVTIFSSCSSTDILKGVEQVLGAAGDGQLTNAQIGQGLKEALTQGISKGAQTVSKTDGYFKNPKIKIPWPEDVRKVESTLRNIGLGKEVDKVVLSLNRAAEDAATKAKPIFVNAIKQLTFQDVMNIVKGPDNAATEFLQRVTTKDLRKEFNPVIGNSLNKVNATKYWGDIITQYNKVPLVKKVDPDLKGYVTDKALKGLFTMVAQEEKKIRKDPIARTTDLMKKVFELQDK